MASRSGSITDNNNPETSVGLLDTRAWTDRDRNGSPFDAAGQIQLNELTELDATPNFGKNIPSTLTTDPAVLTGWGARGYNWEYNVSVQHELTPRVSISGDWYRRKFGNQTVTVDNRYSFDQRQLRRPVLCERSGRLESCRAAAVTRCAACTT